jgi:hypothetical protein
MRQACEGQPHLFARTHHASATGTVDKALSAFPF